MIQYSTLIENIKYFSTPGEVPLGTLLGNPQLNCSKEEFKNILIEVLEKYNEAFEILRET